MWAYVLVAVSVRCYVGFGVLKVSDTDDMHVQSEKDWGLCSWAELSRRMLIGYVV